MGAVCRGEWTSCYIAQGFRRGLGPAVWSIVILLRRGTGWGWSISDGGGQDGCSFCQSSYRTRRDAQRTAVELATGGEA